MNNNIAITIHLDRTTGQMKVQTGGLQPLELAMVLSQMTTQLIVQNSAGLIVAPPARPVSVLTQS
jgi:hypothetical protein